jgi:hypothetical protein
MIKALQVAFKDLLRTLHKLFLEMTGFFFLAIGGMILLSGYRQLRIFLDLGEVSYFKITSTLVLESSWWDTVSIRSFRSERCKFGATFVAHRELAINCAIMSTSRKFETTSKIPLKPYYVPADLPVPFDYSTDLGNPGEFPFTRGIQPDMYRGRLWTMRQYAGYATASESNVRFKYLLGLGQRGLSVAFDLPTQMGMDSSAPLACGEWAWRGHNDTRTTGNSVEGIRWTRCVSMTTMPRHN